MTALENTQQALDEVSEAARRRRQVVRVMRANIGLVGERSTKLDALADRAQVLEMGAASFQKRAVIVKKKKWWENYRMTLLVVGTVALFGVAGIGSGRRGKRGPQCSPSSEESSRSINKCCTQFRFACTRATYKT